ncbi:hypothetical protein ACQVTZ_26995 [Bacillus cereus]|uniref:hypothetical protein n=1 Tax=Bacillus cereus TaxID=1396 RepID=UPI003D650F9F|nr:hypothetical protein [Bacillus cereus]MCU5589817.1 hypothetical protein [Bacillus cereus]
MNQRTEQAIHKLIDKGLFFSVNKSKLARLFLEEVLGINVFRLNKEEVSKMICEKYGYKLEELQYKEEELYLFVAHNIMRIKENVEPYEYFNNEVILVMKDLKKINSMIQEYESKQQVKDIDRYEKKKYQYLVEKLNKAKNEVCEYMTGNINSQVYKEIKIRDKKITFTNIINEILNPPYPFRGNEEEYEMTVFAGLKYKFEYMTIREYEKLKIKHLDNKIEFYELVDIYINSNDFGQDILSQIEENHVLNKRVMLKQAIEVYKEGRMELFCQIIPLQIEGIIYDYCIELGVSPSNIDRVPLDKKVEEIVARDKSFKCHEYFKYDFIELRNTAAHGRLHDDVNYKDTANMLILDLMYLCEFVNSSNATSVNRMRNLVKEIELTKEEKVVGWEFIVDLKVLEFINEYRKESLPPFYNSNKEIQEIISYVHSESFLEHIKLFFMLPAMLSPEEIENIKKILVYLRKNTDLGEECTRLLKELPKSKNDK